MILTHNCSCWLVSRPTPFVSDILYHEFKKENEKKKQNCLARGGFVLQLTVSRKCRCALPCIVFIYFSVAPEHCPGLLNESLLNDLAQV